MRTLLIKNKIDISINVNLFISRYKSILYKRKKKKKIIFLWIK